KAAIIRRADKHKSSGSHDRAGAAGSSDILFACRQRFIQTQRHLPGDVAGVRVHGPQAPPWWFLTRRVSDGLSTGILNWSGKPVIRPGPIVSPSIVWLG